MHTEGQLFQNISSAGLCAEEPWWMSSRLGLPAAAMQREGWMSAQQTLCMHTPCDRSCHSRYKGEIPRAILAPHSSSPTKNLSLDTATSFPNASALAIPHILLPQQLLLIIGLGEKSSSHPSAIGIGPGILFAKMFSIRIDSILKAVWSASTDRDVFKGLIFFQIHCGSLAKCYNFTA